MAMLRRFRRVRVCIHSATAHNSRRAVSHLSTDHALRAHQIQSVSQAATEVPVLQIWTDQSPQP